MQDSSFDALQSGQALNAGQCDLAASAMTITEDRKKALDFCDGYYDSQQSLLVPDRLRHQPPSATSPARRSASSRAPPARATPRRTPPTPTSSPSRATRRCSRRSRPARSTRCCRTSRSTSTTPRTAAFDVVETYTTDEQYGFAIKKGNTALVDAVDEQLKTMRDDGTYDEIYDSYFATE